MPDCSEMARTVNDIALAIGARPGIKDINGIVGEMQKDFPEITRDHVVSSILEASAANTRTLGETAKKLQQLRLEARRTSEPLQRQKLVARITELSKQLEQPPPPKMELPKAQSAELDRLQYQRDRLQSQIRQKIQGMKPKGIFQRAAGVPAEAFNAARAVMTSMDFSAVFRQGGFIALAHPIRAAREIGPMLRAFASDQASHKINNEILNRPNAPMYAKSKLYLSPMEETGLNAKEEAFMSHWVKKIPGVAASERAYGTFLNKLRADSFDAMTRTLARNGEATHEEASAIANFINVATGRGKLYKAEQAATTLNTIFFAPKYLASRVQLLAGQPLVGGSMRTRGMIAGEYGRYLAGVGIVYALGAAAGGKIEKDPRSSDFGKIRFGDTRLDPLSGFAQLTTFTGRVASGDTKDSRGRVVPIRGPKVPYAGMNEEDVLKRFFRSKLSPIGGASWDVISGKDMAGKPATLKGEAANYAVPMSVNDVYKAMQDQGVPKGAALGLLNIFGMGVQTYHNKPRRD